MTIKKINPRDVNKAKIPQPMKGRAKSKKVKVKLKEEGGFIDVKDEEEAQEIIKIHSEIPLQNSDTKKFVRIETEQKEISDEEIEEIKKTAREKSLPALIDCIEVNEDNKHIRITLTKQKNRMLRLQVYLNDTEIRPSTFTGTSPALSYWKLLQGICK